jgi:hypothetical protein
MAKDWYRRYGLPPKSKHPDTTPDHSTEPKFLIHNKEFAHLL